jgi:murein DD-endopeptidase MepM/ murein hydrolase activator NlpD
VSPVYQYKKFENRVTGSILKNLSHIGGGIAGFFRKVMLVGKQHFTVMFIPHSEKKIFNFRISVFSLVFLSILLTGILVAFFLSSTYFSGLSRNLSRKSASLETTQASLEVVRDEIADLQKVSNRFESTLSQTLETLGLSEGESYQSEISGGDLSSLFSLEEQEEGILRELSDLKSLSAFLDESVNSLEAITDLLISQGELLQELPTLWPLQGVRGRITNYFGPAEHPFTRKWYLHKGIDIAYRIGTPVICTADGKVVEKKYEPMGFGHYIVVRHKYGFYTKYAHLQTVSVKEGELVSQGQKVGTLGNTGLSTGPHLHYEVRIGSQVVDPERYLNIKSGLRNVSYSN